MGSGFRGARLEGEEMFLSALRKPVDSFAPSVGRLYRRLRDVSVAQRARQTIYGFTLAGDPRMVRSDFESEEVKAFLELLENHDTVLDIGANVGFYSCLAASRGKHVVSFEPSLRNLNFLYRNLWENKFSSVEILPLGLAKQSGLSRIYGFGGISSFVAGWGQAETSKYSLVPVTTLDAALAKRFQGKRLLIKVDVEGFELDVLAGAIETLNLEPKPTWMAEILLHDGVIPGGTNTRFHETFEMFWKRGYQCRKLDKTHAPVQNVDVQRWVTCGTADCKNFLFSSTNGNS
jgi:FkbM family methyltransferase